MQFLLSLASMKVEEELGHRLEMMIQLEMHMQVSMLEPELLNRVEDQM
jgi:hypothetical protein